MSTTHKKRKAGSRRAEIIDKATDLFLENGFSGTSMAELAKACQMQKASLYYHFKTKEELFAACITEGHACSLDTLETISRDEDAPPAERLRAAIANLYQINVDSKVGRMSPLIAEVSRAIPSVAKRFHQDFMVKEQSLLEKIIDDGVAEGAFRRIDPPTLRYMIVGPIITLSLAREMFATFDNLDQECPADHIRQHHIEQILRLLAKDGLSADREA